MFDEVQNRPPYFVDNKAKGQISKWVFQENKARQIFRKTNISYPWYAHARLVDFWSSISFAVKAIEKLTCVIYLLWNSIDS